MSAATFVNPPNVLGEAISLPGGVRIADALAKAAKNLETIRAPTLEAMDGCIEEIEALCAQGGARPSEADSRRIYDLSNDVIGVAGVFGLDGLSAAAFSLCELVDCFRSLDRWNQPAVMVHLSSFRLLRHADADVDHANILDGLHRLTRQAEAIAI
jgi:hypothetical protein